MASRLKSVGEDAMDLAIMQEREREINQVPLAMDGCKGTAERCHIPLRFEVALKKTHILWPPYDFVGLPLFVFPSYSRSRRTCRSSTPCSKTWPSS